MAEFSITPAQVFNTVQCLVRPKIVRKLVHERSNNCIIGDPPLVKMTHPSGQEEVGRMTLQLDYDATVDLVNLAHLRSDTRRAFARGLERVERRSAALAAATHLPSAVRYMAMLLPYPIHHRPGHVRSLVIAFQYQTALDVGAWPSPVLRELYGFSDSAVEGLIADARHRFKYLLPYSPVKDRPLSGMSRLVGSGPRTLVFLPDGQAEGVGTG